jgi:hypothetical protein
MVVASVVAGVKDSRGGGVHTDDRLIGARFASTQDPPVQVKARHGCGADVLNITLVSRHTGIIERDAVYDLLSECSWDVSCNALVLHTFVVCYLVLNS